MLVQGGGLCSVCAATALVSTPSSGSPVKGEFSQDTIFFDYSKILECCSTPLLLHIRHPPSLGTKILESSTVDLNPPLVFQNIGEKNSAHMIVSWSCLFSKHTVILTPSLRGILQLKVLSAKIHLQLQQPSHVDSPWLYLGRKELLKIFIHVVLCVIWQWIFHLFFKYSYWTSLHGLTFTNFSKQRHDHWITKIKPGRWHQSCELLLQYTVLCCFVSVDDKSKSIENLIISGFSPQHHCFL